MKTTKLVAALVAAVTLVLAGCNTEKQEGKDYAVLKKGQQVAGAMVGWIAVPNTTPVIKKDDAKGVSYALLATDNIVLDGQDGWVAVNPAFFTKLSDIAVPAAAAKSSQKWVLKPEGKFIPKDKDGWVALPYSEPQIEASSHKKDRELAVLSLGNVIPKELNGWVAVDKETLAKLTQKFMMSGPGSKVSKE